MIIKNICSALIVVENKFVIVKESDGYMTGKWNLPGGHLENNENIHKATIREAKEETNLDIKLDGLIGVYQFKSPANNNVIYFCFKALVVGGELKYQEGELEEIKLVSFKDFLHKDDNEIGGIHLKVIIKDFLKNGARKNMIYIKGL